MADIASKLNSLEEWLSEDLITQEDYERKKASLTDEFMTETSPVTKSKAEEKQLRDEITNIILPQFNKYATKVGNVDPIGTDKLEEMENYVNSISGQELEQTYQTMIDALNTQTNPLIRPQIKPRGIELFIGPKIGLTEAQLIPDLWTSLLKSQGWAKIKPPMFGTYNMNQPWKPHIVQKPFEEDLGIKSIVPQAVGLEQVGNAVYTPPPPVPPVPPVPQAVGPHGNGGGRDEGPSDMQQRFERSGADANRGFTRTKYGKAYQRGGVVSLMDLLNRRV